MNSEGEPRPFNGKRISFQQMVLGKLDIYIQKNEVEHLLCIQKLKWIKDKRAKTVKL